MVHCDRNTFQRHHRLGTWRLLYNVRGIRDWLCRWHRTYSKRLLALVANHGGHCATGTKMHLSYFCVAKVKLNAILGDELPALQ